MFSSLKLQQNKNNLAVLYPLCWTENLFVLFFHHSRERAENILSKEFDNKAKKATKQPRMGKYLSAQCNL